MLILTTIATAAVLATAAVPARSQEIPNLNVDPVCRGIAQQGSTVAEKGSPDLAFSQCIQSEQAMRQKLAGEMVDVLAERKGQLHRRDLISCLEMARDARQLNQGK